MNEFTLKRLDYLYHNHPDKWPHDAFRDCALELIVKADTKGLHNFAEWELEMANSLVEMMISQPNYKPDYMDEY